MCSMVGYYILDCVKSLLLFPIIITGSTLTRQRFATVTVDKDNNFKFEYDNNFSNDKVFPG